MPSGSDTHATRSLLREGWMPIEQAASLYVAFERRYGEGTSLFTCHAAFPFILSPELVNLIRINFLPEVPWYAEADLLLSPFCHSIKGNLYQVDPSVRDVMKLDLKQRAPDGPHVLLRLADFVLSFAGSHLAARYPSDVLRAYRWIAWSHLRPQAVVDDMTQMLSDTAEALAVSRSVARKEQLHIALMLDMLRAPIENSLPPESYHDLIETAQVLAHYWYRGPDVLDESATRQATRENSILRKMASVLRPTRTATPYPTTLQSQVLEWFTDRHSELAAFREILHGRTGVRVLLIHAPHGVGKSWLIQRFWHECLSLRRTTVVIDFRDPHAASSWGIIQQAYDQLRNQLGAEALEPLTEVIEETAEIRGRFGTAGEQLGQAAPPVATGEPDGDSISLESNVVNIPAGTAIRQEIEYRINAAFFDCLAPLTELEREAVFLFDSYEEASQEARQWLRDQLLERLRDGGLDNVPIVFAGRETPEPSGWWDGVSTTISLAPFTEADVAQYLANRGFKGLDPGLVYNLSNGVPLKIREIAESFQEPWGETGDPRAVELLIAALGDKDGNVRREAAAALGEIGDARAVESLVAALRHGYRDVRSKAAEALGQIGDARAVEPLIAALGDEDGNVRREATAALGKIGDARAVEPLIAALSDLDGKVRLEAAGALGEIGDAAAVEPLIVALQDEDSDVRSGAAQALSEIGDVRAVEPPTTALPDEDEIELERPLPDLLQTLLGQASDVPWVSEPLTHVRISLEYTCQQIRSMSEYLNARDLLQQLDSTYRALHDQLYVEFGELRPLGPRDWRVTARSRAALQISIAKLVEQVETMSFRADAEKWLGSLRQASKDLQAAYDRRETRLLDEAMYDIDHVTLRTASRISDRLIATIKELRLSDLVDKLGSVFEIVKARGSKSTVPELDEFQRIIAELGSMSDQLATYRQELDAWQQIDNILRVEETQLLGRSASSLKRLWERRLREQIVALCVPHTENWAHDLLSRIDELDAALAATPVDERDVAYALFELRVAETNRLVRVISDLKRLCDVLTEACGSLVIALGGDNE